MKRFSVATILFITLLSGVVSAQKPERELRGVWLTTLFGLDWPHTSQRNNPREQKASLVRILDDIKSKNFNTVFFQVRSRGNAMYRSTMEPWASELSGRLGEDPGWDPLDFAIRECRKRGLEIHAWFNVSRVWTKGAPPQTQLKHLYHLHRSWVKRYGDDLWIDPGIPAARQYTLLVLEDLVRHYDIDGIHLDYCRYPDRDFKDTGTYRRFGNGKDKQQWRRDNINALVRNAYSRLTSIRPSLIVGSAPIGIYTNLPTAKGWEGRNAISQDSRVWLRDGYQDYVVPQIYWGLKAFGSRIDFAALVRDWKDNSAGRHVYAGIAAYKDKVKAHLLEHVSASRRNGADGEVFFRYEHIADRSFSGPYQSPALAPPLTWRDHISPNPPLNIAIVYDGAYAQISWQPPVPATDGDVAVRYGVYRLPDEADAGHGEIDIAEEHSGIDYSDAELIAILPGDLFQYTDAATAVESGYAVTALDAFRNESGFAVPAPPLAAEPIAPPPLIDVLVTTVSEPVFFGEDLILIGYTLSRRSHVRLRLMDDKGSEAGGLIDGMQDAGMHLVGIERSKLTVDVEAYVFEAGGKHLRQDLDL